VTELGYSRFKDVSEESKKTISAYCSVVWHT